MHFPPKLQWYEYHLLITDAYNYIYETNSRPRLSFPIMHTGYQEKKCFFKLNYILKILGTCMDCLQNQSMFI